MLQASRKRRDRKKGGANHGKRPTPDTRARTKPGDVVTGAFAFSGATAPLSGLGRVRSSTFS